MHDITCSSLPAASGHGRQPRRAKPSVMLLLIFALKYFPSGRALRLTLSVALSTSSGKDFLAVQTTLSHCSF